MTKDAKKKIKLPEFVRLSHYQIQLLLINSQISEECAEQQGSFHSRSMRIYLDEDIINLYVVNQIKNENLASDRQWNGGITKIEYDTTTGTGTSVALDSPTFKVWQINRGVGTGTTMPNSDYTTFNDITWSGFVAL